MNKINDITKYVQELNKSLVDKLWFKRFLDIFILHESTIVYDFGCGDGGIINALALFYPEVQFIGIDANIEMISIANKNKHTDNVNFYNKSYPIINDKQKILILSSVFHEIISYSDWLEFYKDVIENINPDYIFFRDTAVSYSTLRNVNLDDFNNFNCENKNYDEQQVVSFILRQGDISIQRNLIHYLLKYRFKDNWERELKECYIPVFFEDIPDRFKDYITIYKKHYILPFIKDKIKEDFNIDLRDNTHCNYIFKRKRND